MLKKLKLKFVVITMSIITVMLVVILGLVYHSTKTDMDAQALRTLQRVSQQGQFSEPPGGREDFMLPHFTITVNMQGKVHAKGNTYYDLSDNTFVADLLAAVARERDTTGELREYNLLFARRLEMGQQVLVFVDTTSQQNALAALARSGAFIGVVSLAVFFALSILLAAWAVKPVEKAWQQQRQFISDASHELKTPLTVIMSNAELLQNPEFDRENQEQFSQSILTMSCHMRSLVEGLLELTRADNGQIKKAFAAVDYSTLIQEALLPFEAVLYEKGLTLNSQIAPGIRLWGSDQHLRQLMGIFLDNAGKYSSAGVVEVVLQRKGRNQCLLQVSNPGKPIPQEDLQRIFERFYRADAARSRTGSFGLGLSIARAIVQDHGGKIWVESNDTGNCFFVQLPCDNE